jgi:hypothetical protein
MTLPKLRPQTLNMIAAWIGSIATLSILILRNPTWMHRATFPIATILAAVALLIIATIVRLKPHPDTILALSGTLGATFSALSYCLFQ